MKKQQAVVRGQPQEALSSSIDRVERQTTRFTRKPWQDKPPNKSLYTQQQSTNNCTWCGKFPSHSRHLCPAREAVCHKCKKKGHFKAVCRSAYNVSVVTVAEEDSSDSDAFLGTVSGTGSSKPWQITMLLKTAHWSLELTLERMSPLFLSPSTTGHEMDRYGLPEESSVDQVSDHYRSEARSQPTFDTAGQRQPRKFTWSKA